MNKPVLWKLGYCWLLLLLFLSACGFPGLVSTSAQLPLVSQKQATPSLPPISFPRDEGVHNDLTEWWYYTGHLEAIDTAGKQHQYGFELVVFRVSRSDLPPIYPAHFAISDITREQFHYDQKRITKVDEDLTNSAAIKGINIQVDNWSIQGLNGHDHLVAAMKDYAINLNLTASKPPVLHNGNGLITYGLAGFSYYYSRTHMDIAGTILDHDQSLHVTGLAWMDHQWGNFLTLGGSGWDWYSIQLNNNTEMMVYFIRDPSGTVISTYASYIDPAGRNYVLPSNALHAIALDTWTSPTTSITYPSGWYLEVNSSQLQAALTMTSLLKDQELVVKSSTGNIYWEGAVSIQGQVDGNPIDGQGYVELTGYGRE
jgi:predicted secreted hydrolase